MALEQGWGVKEKPRASTALQLCLLDFGHFSLVFTLGNISDDSKNVINLSGLLLYSLGKLR